MSEEKTKVAAVVPQKVHETKIKRKKKKIGNEIDEIFQGKKRKSAAADDQQAKDRGKQLDKVIGEGGSSKTKDKKKRMKVDLNEDSGTPGRRRRTADGLAIYSADELGWGKADVGGTPLCPFDCSCCF
ncbi:uncharacterized protein C6G9.01c-like [Zingiber officinale]|uniref:DUF1764-domain-containing protein n=1 Tax=Zingiber officinale TaxID=94328 RepID=A0A8J5GJY8_ZINOF|nr:uncharacterized protein C6G9.01c-like [Zingiber officinale]KAG6508304.1 hypothetical protein ZIOFF_033678 [Zingiber officinale]